MRKVAIYCRVSTEEQARVEEGSIKNQVETLSKYIEAENMKEGKWGTLVEVYKDEGYSAKNLNRPALKRLLLDISKRRVTTVAHNFLRTMALLYRPDKPHFSKKMRRRFIFLPGKLVKHARQLVMKIPRRFMKEVMLMREWTRAATSSTALARGT